MYRLSDTEHLAVFSDEINMVSPRIRGINCFVGNEQVQICVL